MYHHQRPGVLVVGTGLAGAVAASAVVARTDMTLEGWVTTTDSKAGLDGSVLGNVPVGLVRTTAVKDAARLLASDGVDVMVYAGIAEHEALLSWFSLAADYQIDVVSVAGPMHPVVALGEEAASDLAKRVQTAGVRLLSTGVNPGFLLDALPLMCASLSPTGAVSIEATRRSDIRWWGKDGLDGYGVGQRPEEWQVGAPHISLRESMQVLIDGLRTTIDDVTENYAPLVATAPRTAGDVVLGVGDISGFTATCIASRGALAVITLTWIGDYGSADRWSRAGTPLHELRVSGDVDVRCSLKGDFLGDSYPATIGRALNAVGPLRSLPPGLYRPDQVPLSPIVD